MTARVLLVDDDPAVLRSLRRVLVLAGYEVLAASDGESALSVNQQEQPDLVVLDVMLPGLDGLTVCRRLRTASPDLPILMLTARDTVPDRVSGLDSGADDYLVKPFAVDEMLARARALLRRSQPGGGEEYWYADLRMSSRTREAFRDNGLLKLTPREYELLEVFLRHPRQALSRDQLCQQVWGFSFGAESNFVDVAVKDLRKKTEEGGRPRLIQTVRGFGYALRQV